MPITVQCPGCKTQLRANDKLAGRRVKCPKCSAVIEVAVSEQQQSSQAGTAQGAASQPPSSNPLATAAPGTPGAEAAPRPKPPVLPISGPRVPDPPPSEPSAALGYVIAAVVVIPLVFMVMLANPRAFMGGVPWWVTGGAMVVFFSIANAINSARRYRVTTGKVVAPVVEQPAAEAQQVAESVDIREKGGRTAGRWANDRFVVSPGDIAAISRNPLAFDNVISGGEPPSPLGGQGRWFLVLAKGAAVAFKVGADQVWSLSADSQEKFTQERQLPKIWSVDGRVQSLDFGADVVAWNAWRSTNVPPRSEMWQLFAWSLTTHKDPLPWLRFRLPYSTVREGLSQLCANSEDLHCLIRDKRVGPTAASQWITHAAPADGPVIVRAIQAVARKKATNSFLGGIGVFALAVVFIPLMLSMSSGFSRNEWALVAFGMMLPVYLFMAIAVGLFVYSWYLRRLAARLGTTASAQMREPGGRTIGATNRTL